MPSASDRPKGRRPGRQAARERIAAKRAEEQAAADRARRRRVQVTTGVVVAVLVVAAVIVTVLVQSARTDTAGAATPANTAPGTGGNAFALGPDDAPVTVDVYEDYLCPNCLAFEQDAGAELDRLISDGDARVLFHPVAILDYLSPDEYSTRAAGAAAAVGDAKGPDAFRAFSKLLFANQPKENGPGLTADQLVELAGQAGASGQAVESAIRDGRFDDWAARATDQASKDGLTGTPRVLVDGGALEVPTGEALTAAVQAAAAG